jgi:hypothetical protein
MSDGVELNGIGFAAETQSFERDRASASEHVKYAGRATIIGI